MFTDLARYEMIRKLSKHARTFYPHAHKDRAAVALREAIQWLRVQQRTPNSIDCGLNKYRMKFAEKINRRLQRAGVPVYVNLNTDSGSATFYNRSDKGALADGQPVGRLYPGFKLYKMENANHFVYRAELIASNTFGDTYVVEVFTNHGTKIKYAACKLPSKDSLQTMFVSSLEPTCMIEATRLAHNEEFISRTERALA